MGRVWCAQGRLSPNQDHPVTNDHRVLGEHGLTTGLGLTDGPSCPAVFDSTDGTDWCLTAAVAEQHVANSLGYWIGTVWNAACNDEAGYEPIHAACNDAACDAAWHATHDAVAHAECGSCRGY